jgi:hypothetical protein
MVGDAEHAELFDALRFWAVRNEARIHTAMSFNAKDAVMLRQEYKRWNMLLDIFDNIALDINFNKQNNEQRN